MGELVLDKYCYECGFKCPFGCDMARFHRNKHKATKGQIKWCADRMKRYAAGGSLK